MMFAHCWRLCFDDGFKHIFMYYIINDRCLILPPCTCESRTTKTIEASSTRNLLLSTLFFQEKPRALINLHIGTREMFAVMHERD